MAVVSCWIGLSLVLTACGDAGSAPSDRAERTSAIAHATPVVRAARSFCKQHTASVVLSKYLPLAARRAAPRERGFLRMVKTHRKAVADPSVLPRVAARVFAMSVAETKRAEAYAACGYELLNKESSR
ncbi:MAG: hypothetical protein ABW167_04930 [Baekduia sp.]